MVKRGLRAVLLVSALVACGGDANIKSLTAGISADSVERVLGEGTGPGGSGSLVYRRLRFLVSGKLFDVLLYDAKGRTSTSDPLVTDEELTPVILIDGKLDSWGWDKMDDYTSVYRIQVRTPKAPPSAKTDSTAKVP